MPGPRAVRDVELRSSRVPEVGRGGCPASGYGSGLWYTTTIVVFDLEVMRSQHHRLTQGLVVSISSATRQTAWNPRRSRIGRDRPDACVTRAGTPALTASSQRARTSARYAPTPRESGRVAPPPKATTPAVVRSATPTATTLPRTLARYRRAVGSSVYSLNLCGRPVYIAAFSPGQKLPPNPTASISALKEKSS